MCKAGGWSVLLRPPCSLVPTPCNVRYMLYRSAGWGLSLVLVNSPGPLQSTFIGQGSLLLRRPCSLVHIPGSVRIKSPNLTFTLPFKKPPGPLPSTFTNQVPCLSTFVSTLCKQIGVSHINSKKKRNPSHEHLQTRGLFIDLN